MASVTLLPLRTTLRLCELDELLGFWDALIGNIYFVCPRPDVPGYADKLKDRVVL